MTTRRPRLSIFAKNLLEEWRLLELPVSEARVVVAVSGGADSSALLLGLDELIKKQELRLQLTIAHLDHDLRDDSKTDADWVSQLAKELGYDVVRAKANLKRKSANSPISGGNLEQAARRARYEFFLKTATRKKAKLVLTAHTLDDQAETILMRLLRGSAAEGLSGIPAVREIERGTKVRLARPLLSWARRSDTENYCRLRQIDFRVDEMNHDETFSRVRVRKQLLPLMKSFNNRVVEALSRTATLLNEDAAALTDEARRLLELAVQKPGVPGRSPRVSKGPVCPTMKPKALANARASAWATNSETKSPALSVTVLLQSPAAVRRRALREWILRSRGDLKRIERVHLVAVEKLLEGERGGRVAELPAGMTVTRKRGMLELSRKKRLKKAPATSKIPRG
jgi:tRNA(Ile)-lysidine synthase